MKIRTDFITNSSSSAFVIIGTELKGEIDYDEIDSIAVENDFYFFSEEKVIGKRVARLSFEDYGPRVVMSLEELGAEFREVRDIFDRYHIEGEVKLITDIFMT